MKFLLDTQAFLWFVLNDRALSQVACNLIVDPLNDQKSVDAVLDNYAVTRYW